MFPLPRRLSAGLLPGVQRLACGLVAVLAGTAAAQSPQATPLTAWFDLRPAAPDATPQSMPNWVEGLEYVAAKPVSTVGSPAQVDLGSIGEALPGTGVNAGGDAARSRAVFRIRLARPPAATDDLQVRVFFDDRAEGARPRVTAWDELGNQLMGSRPLGQGLGLPSSETLTVQMHGVNYLEIESAADGTQVRGVFLTWLKRTEVRQPADFTPAPVVAQPFNILNAKRGGAKDSYLYGVVTASLRRRPLVLDPSVNPSLDFEFELDRPPLVAVVTFEVLGAEIALPPPVIVNRQDAGPATLFLPDLADPAYQGDARDPNAPMAFRYTGWLRGQKVIPAGCLTTGLNVVTLGLSNPTDSLAVRSVEVQLKYDWEKFDYLPTPAASPATP